MRHLTRAVVAGAVVVAATCTPVRAMAATPSALVVPATGATVTTPFSTSPSLHYTITVSGTFAADRIGTLADCGYRDTNAGVVGQDWQAGGAGLLIDGTHPWCGAYSPAHRYALRVRGTGAAFAFAVSDGSGTSDNAGALAVEVVAESSLRVECRVERTGLRFGGGGELEGAAVAAAAWHEGLVVDAVATTVECVTTQGTPGSVWRGTWPGPATAAHGLDWFDPSEPVTVCVSASSARLDGTSRTSGWSCSTQLLEEKR